MTACLNVRWLSISNQIQLNLRSRIQTFHGGRQGANQQLHRVLDGIDRWGPTSQQINQLRIVQQRSTVIFVKVRRQSTAAYEQNIMESASTAVAGWKQHAF